MTVTLAMLNKEMYRVNIVVWHMCHIGFKPKITKSKYKETEQSCISHKAECSNSCWKMWAFMKLPFDMRNMRNKHTYELI